jgi:fluoride exporter
MKSYLLVMAGGSIGAALRYLLAQMLPAPQSIVSWPWATFAANIIGGFAVGAMATWLSIAALDSTRIAATQDLRLLLIVGLLGGFTTFSAFSLEMAIMIDQGYLIRAFSYAAASVLIALAAVFAGQAAARAVLI